MLDERENGCFLKHLTWNPTLFIPNYFAYFYYYYFMIFMLSWLKKINSLNFNRFAIKRKWTFYLTVLTKGNTYVSNEIEWNLRSDLRNKPSCLSLRKRIPSLSNFWDGWVARVSISCLLNLMISIYSKTCNYGDHNNVLSSSRNDTDNGKLELPIMIIKLNTLTEHTVEDLKINKHRN